MDKANWTDIEDQSVKVRNKQLNEMSFDDGELPEFRCFTRAEIYDCLGLASADGVKGTVKLVEQHIKETTGSDIEIGYRDPLSSVYMYKLSEVHLMLDTLPLIQKTRRKNKVTKAMRAPDEKGAFVISVANQKGGSGKTTFTINLSIGQAITKFKRPRILVIDFDPQGSLHPFYDGREISIFDTPTISKYLQHNEYFDVINVNSTLEEKRDFLKNNVIRKSLVDNLDYCPAFSEDLSLLPNLVKLNGVDSEDDDFSLVTRNWLDSERTCAKKYSGDRVFKIFREEVIEPLKNDYDLIIIDTAPQATHFTQIALYASDYLIVPAPTKRMDFDSTQQFIEQTASWMNTVVKESDDLDFDCLKYFNLFSNMYDKREKTHAKIELEYRVNYLYSAFPYPVSSGAIYGSLADEHLSIYSKSSFGQDSWKTAKAEWETINDHVYRVINKEWGISE